MPEEIWKDIPGYEGAYQASSLGRIRSLTRQRFRNVDGKQIPFGTLHGRVLTVGINKKGYQYVVLCVNGKSASKEVHALVAKTFLGERTVQDEQIRHLDGNPRNNTVENLRYGTRSENQLDLYSYRGRHHRLTPENVLRIRERIAAGDKSRDIARDFGVTESNISEIKHGRSFAWLR